MGRICSPSITTAAIALGRGSVRVRSAGYLCSRAARFAGPRPTGLLVAAGKQEDIRPFCASLRFGIDC